MEYIFAALVEGRTNNWAGSYMVRTSALFAFIQTEKFISLDMDKICNF